MRTIVDLPDSLLKQLDESCRLESISRAEGVRRAVADYLASKPPPAKDAAFGIWKGRRIDALKYVDSLRNEW
jgi:metal-responsive CopG/Arc/MetJ family transcriptional regulator